MLKKFLIYLFVFTILIMIGDYGIGYTIGKQIDHKSPYQLSFASIGANSLESRMDCWATIRKESSTEELKNHLAQILHCFNLPADESKYIFFTDDKVNSLQYETFNENLNGYFCIETDLEKHETCIVISVVTENNEIALSDYEEKLVKLVIIPETEWQYYYLYTACLDYMVAPDCHKELLEVINKRIQTRNIEVFQNDNAISTSGYSPLLVQNGQESAINHKIYNVQIAIRNNNFEKKTYVMIGSPLILGDY